MATILLGNTGAKSRGRGHVILESAPEIGDGPPDLAALGHGGGRLDPQTARGAGDPHRAPLHPGDVLGPLGQGLCQDVGADGGQQDALVTYDFYLATELRV